MKVVAIYIQKSRKGNNHFYRIIESESDFNEVGDDLSFGKRFAGAAIGTVIEFTTEDGNSFTFQNVLNDYTLGDDHIALVEEYSAIQRAIDEQKKIDAMAAKKPSFHFDAKVEDLIRVVKRMSYHDKVRLNNYITAKIFAA